LIEAFENHDPSARCTFFDRKIYNARFRDMIFKFRKAGIIILFPFPPSGSGPAAARENR
jgi:hypothetical protein